MVDRPYETKHTGGTNERGLSASTGLRNFFMKRALRNVTYNSTVNTFAVANGGNPPQWTNIPILAGRTRFAHPGTIAIQYSIGAAAHTPGGGTVQFRIRGWDQFGNAITETLPIVSLPACKIELSPNVIQGICHIYSSRVFSAVTTIEYWGAGLRTLDTINIGQAWPFNTVDTVGPPAAVNAAIAGVSIANPSVITVTQNPVNPLSYDLRTGSVVLVHFGTVTGTTPNISHTSYYGTVTSATTFTIPVNVTGSAGPTGTVNISGVSNDFFVGTANVGLGTPMDISPYGKSQTNYVAGTNPILQASEVQSFSMLNIASSQYSVLSPAGSQAQPQGGFVLGKNSSKASAPAGTISVVNPLTDYAANNPLSALAISSAATATELNTRLVFTVATAHNFPLGAPFRVVISGVEWNTGGGTLNFDPNGTWCAVSRSATTFHITHSVAITGTIAAPGANDLATIDYAGVVGEQVWNGDDNKVWVELGGASRGITQLPIVNTAPPNDTALTTCAIMPWQGTVDGQELEITMRTRKSAGGDTGDSQTSKYLT